MIKITIIVIMIAEKSALGLIAVCVDTFPPIRCEVGEVSGVSAGYLESLEQLSYLLLHLQVLALQVKDLALTVSIDLLQQLSQVVNVVHEGLFTGLKLVYAVLQLPIKHSQISKCGNKNIQ